MLGPGFVPISEQLGITVNTISQATAWLILTLGICVFFMNPLAKIFGKRMIYIFASTVLVVVSIWVRKSRPFKPILVRPDSISREPLQTRTAASWEAEFSARLEWHHTKCLSKQQSQTSTLSTSEEPASQYGTSSCLLESLALASSVATSSRTSGTNG